MDTLGPVKGRSTAAIATAVFALSAFAGSAGGTTGGAGPGGGSDQRNPCAGPEAARLLCPDLRVGPAADLFVSRSGGQGSGAPGGEGAYGYSSRTQVRLHAGNDIRSRGRGPIELRGQRIGPGLMRANQAIRRVGGGVKIVRSQIRLRYFDVGARFGGYWWKVEDPLSMEIWTLDERRKPLRRVRKGPKVYYCFRDLERTQPSRVSPQRRVYGACSQDGTRQRTRMGTSVGWSDIYPATYDRQWVDVTGLRGCFAYVMQVDPYDYLHESNERNNRSTRIVRLPYRPGPQRC